MIRATVGSGLHRAVRTPFDRLIARDDFAEFNCVAVDATSGAAIKPVCCCRSDNGGGDLADACRAVIVDRKPYLIDANTI